MNGKPKIAMYWLAGCGGCEESILDMAGRLLSLQERIEIVCWPIAMDTKRHHIESLDAGEIDCSLINGAVRTREHAEMAELLREKSRMVFAHGACAHIGGVPGLANFFSRDQLLECAFRHQEAMDSDGGKSPADIPLGSSGKSSASLLPNVLPLEDVIAVDGVIPGCPPTPDIMKSVFDSIVGEEPGPSGNRWGESAALCRTCPLRATVPKTVNVSEFKRLHTTRWDPERCFLAQGLICLGPVTRGGCQARCIAARMPCRGCFGPADSGADPGAGAISLVASMIETGDDESMEKSARSVADPAGLFYRYGLAASRLKGRMGDKG